MGLMYVNIVKYDINVYIAKEVESVPIKRGNHTVNNVAVQPCVNQSGVKQQLLQNMKDIV
jgi:hypothetical protein